ncbi:MAG TPA: AraC family transcriptional regulator [Pyrinomonadaceae bacterium]|jgi:AraC family transcriptional regulator
MLATQMVSATGFPAFIDSIKERKLKEPTETLKISDMGRNQPAQTAVEAFAFNVCEIVASSCALGWKNIKAFEIRHEREMIKTSLLQQHCVVLQMENSFEIEVCVGAQKIKKVLRPGELMIFPAGSSLQWRWRQGGKPNKALYFFLEPQFLKTIAESFNFKQPAMIEPAIGIDDEQLRYLALSLLCEMRNANILGQFYAETLAKAFAMQIVRQYSHFREVRVAPPSIGGLAPFKLRKALGFIDENLECEEDLSLEKIAGEVGMSYFHFSRTFKQSMGVSPNNYITRRRIELAKKLLAYSEAPIADIALQVGFASQSHFTTMFRRQTGMTPKDYRRNL